MCGPLVKMLINLDSCRIIGSKLVYLCIFKFPATGIKKIDETSPGISLAGQALLAKMLIFLEPHCAFGSDFKYLCISSLSSFWYAKWLRGFIEHNFGRSCS